MKKNILLLLGIFLLVGINIKVENKIIKNSNSNSEELLEGLNVVFIKDAGAMQLPVEEGGSSCNASFTCPSGLNLSCDADGKGSICGGLEDSEGNLIGIECCAWQGDTFGCSQGRCKL